MRRLAIALVCVVLVGAGCSGAPDGPQIYAVDADAPSLAGRRFQVSAYFPGEMRVHAGDTIRFTNRSTQAPHTITFGVKADRSNQPQLLTPTGENPAAFGVCYSEENPTPKLTTCPHKKLPSYNGSGYWNSGLLQTSSAPNEAGPKGISVTIADGTPKGEYTFVCVLHPFMNGAVTVVDSEDEPDAPGDTLARGKAAQQRAVRDALAIVTPRAERDGDVVTVTAGWGDRVTSVNRFAPRSITVTVGTTVRWLTRSPFEPHTVTFASPYTRPADPASFRPSGASSGSGYSGGLANSGLLGPPGGPFPSGPYSLRFTKPRAYNYVCTLHPGQTGVVIVR